MLRDLVTRFGSRPLCVLGEQRITYAEADAESARLARGLLAQGVAKGARVAVLFPNGPEWVIAWLAASRIGAVVVPLNTFYKPRELGYVLRHADVHTLLTAPRLLGNDYLERLEAVAPSLARQRGGPLFAPELPHLRAVYVFGGDRRTRMGAAGVGADGALPTPRPSTPPSSPPRRPRSRRPIPPCSSTAPGSTADPKGALHSHGTVVRHPFNLNQFRDLRPDDRLFSPMPFFWVGGLVFTLLAAMHAGACLVCEEFFEPGATLALLERERATIAAGWPHYSKALAEHPSFASRDLSSIRAGNLYAVLPAREAAPRIPSCARTRSA